MLPWTHFTNLLFCLCGIHTFNIAVNLDVSQDNLTNLYEKTSMRIWSQSHHMLESTMAQTSLEPQSHLVTNMQNKYVWVTANVGKLSHINSPSSPTLRKKGINEKWKCSSHITPKYACFTFLKRHPGKSSNFS